jgi:hypothetical protein
MPRGRVQGDGGEMKHKSDLIKLAAECHRSKWQFVVDEEAPPTRAAAISMMNRAFDELHRLGDMALKLKEALE